MNTPRRFSQDSPFGQVCHDPETHGTYQKDRTLSCRRLGYLVTLLFFLLRAVFGVTLQVEVLSIDAAGNSKLCVVLELVGSESATHEIRGGVVIAGDGDNPMCKEGTRAF